MANEVFVGKELNNIARIIFICVGIVMIICGVLGNWILFAVIFRGFRQHRNAHNLFIANLALADTLIMGYWFPLVVADFILGSHPVINTHHCVANGVIIATLICVVILSLTSISFNRYMHICHTRIYKRFFTMHRFVASCILTWVFGLLLSIPPIWGNHEDFLGHYIFIPNAHLCSYDREGFTFTKLTILMITCGSMFSIAYCNFAIFRHWKKSKMNLSRRSRLSCRRNIHEIPRQEHDLQAKTITDSQVKLSDHLVQSLAVTEEGVVTRNQKDKCLKPVGLLQKWTLWSITKSGRILEFLRGKRSATQLDPLKRRSTVTWHPYPDSQYKIEKDNKDEKLSDDVEILSNISLHPDSQNKTERDNRSDKLSDDLEISSNISLHPDSQNKTERDNRSDKLSDDLKISSKHPDSQYKTKRDNRRGKLSDDVEIMSNISMPPDSQYKIENSQISPEGIVFNAVCNEKIRETNSKDQGHDLAQTRKESWEQPASEHIAFPSLPALAVHSRESHRSLRKSKSKEAALVRTLFVVSLFTFITFIPYCAVLVAYDHLTDQPEINITSYYFLFINSSFNWLVYGITNPNFKKGYVNYICCSESKQVEKYPKRSSFFFPPVSAATDVHHYRANSLRGKLV